MKGEKDYNNLDVVINQREIEQRVMELGEIISQDYASSESPPVIVAVLRGSVYFVVDLTRKLSVPFHLDFMGISSYGGSSDPFGVVRITKDLEVNIYGRDVLLVENIVDTGLTLNYLLKNLYTRRPSSIRVCAFIDMKARRLIDVPIDYKGFELPDLFVVGYGLDYQECYRNLNEIASLKVKPKEKN